VDPGAGQLGGEPDGDGGAPGGPCRPPDRDQLAGAGLDGRLERGGDVPTARRFEVEVG
jgi:hypothetical protein